MSLLLVLVCVCAPAAHAAPRANAADVDYGPLRRVGVTAGTGVIEGKVLSVTIRVSRRTEVRLAVVNGDDIQAFAKATLRKGRHRFSGPLRGTPRASEKPELRVSALIVGTRRRGRERRRISFRTPPVTNQAPTDILLSPGVVAENAVAGTQVGGLSATDPDAGQAHAFALVPGAGSTDNGSFAISAGQLVTTSPLNFEAGATRSIRVRASDSSGATFEKPLTVGIGDVNEAPALLALNKTDVDENSPAGSTVGGLSSSDPEVFDTPTYSLVTGAGDADNALFTVDGTLLKTKAPLDFEAKPARSVLIRVEDGKGGSETKAFTISVNDLNEAPTGLALVPKTVAENEPVGTTVGTLSASDEDSGSTLVFSLVPGAGGDDNALFSISGSTLRTAAPLDFEAAGTRTVRVRASDGKGGIVELPFTITVTDTQDPPELGGTAAPLAYTENDPATAVDPGLTIQDDDDTNLESATVRFISGHEPDDSLLFSDQNGITGSYDGATGILALTGTSSLANYQTALRSVQYRNTGDNPATAKTIRFVAGDGDDDSLPVTRSVTVTRVNDAPTISTTAAALSYPENAGPLAADAGATITDPDSTQIQGAVVQITGNHVQAQDTLAFANQLGISGAYDDATGTLTLSGTATLASYQAALNAVTYENVDDQPFPLTRTLSFRVTDAEGADSAPATRDVTLGPANDAATVTTTPSALTYSEGEAAKLLDAALTVNDPDDITTTGARVTISSGHQSADSLIYSTTHGISGVYNSGTGVLTLSGVASRSGYQAALRSIQYEHTGDDPVAVKTVGFQVNDGDGLGPASTRNITISAVNDAPVTAVPGGQTLSEDGSRTFSSGNGNPISVSDPDAGTAPLQVTLGVTNGTVTLGGTSGLTFTTGDGTSDATLIFTGTQAAINTALNGLVYSPAANFNGSDTLQVEIDDQGNTGSGGAKTDSDSVGLTVTAVNDAPINTLPADPTLDEDGLSTFAGASAISIADVDAGASPLKVTLTVSHGRLTLNGTSGLAFSAGDGTADATMTFAGSRSDINAALNGLVYTPDADYNGTDTLEIITDDQGNTGSGGAQTDTDSRTLTITAVNDAPVNTVPGARSVNEDTILTLAAANAISVADVDAGGNAVSVTLGVAHGTLTLPATSGLTFGQGDGTADAAMAFTGTVAAVNAALDGLQYLGDLDYAGTDVLTITTSDQGNVGSGGARSDSDTVGITLNPVNDDPAAGDDSGAGFATTEDATFDTPDVRANDTDPENDALSVASFDDALTAGTVTQKPNGVFGYDPGSAFQALDTGESDTDTFDYTVSDGSLADTGTVTVAITGANDAPVAVNDSYAAPTGSVTASAATGVLGNDTDVDVESLTAALVAGPGDAQEFSLNANGSFTYVANPGFSGSDSFTYKANDGTVDGNTATVTINFNQAPTAASQSVTTDEDAPKIVTLSASDAEGDATTGFVVNDPPNGAVGTVGSISCSGATPNVCTANVTYTPDADHFGPDSFTFTASDGFSSSAAATVDITVDPVNDAPQLLGMENTALAYTENDPATLLTASTTITDVDTTSFGGGMLTVDYSAGGESDDRLSILSQGTAPGEIRVLGSDLFYGGTPIGFFTGGSGTTPLVVFFSADATIDAARALVKRIAFHSVSEDPIGARLVRFVVSDGVGGTSAPAVRSVGITQANDAPVNAVPGAQTLSEDGSRTFSIGNGNPISVSDPDAGTSPLQVTLSASNGTLTLNGSTGLSFTSGDGTNDAAMTFTGSESHVNGALDGVIYTPAANYNGPDTLQLTTDDQGNTGSGGALSDSDSVGLTINPSNDAPVNTVPGGQTLNEDGSRTFSSGNGNQVAVNDPDAGTAPLQVTVGVTNGTVTLNGTTGLAFTAGDGTNDLTTTFTGSQSDVNAALNGLVYAPNGNFNGPDTLQITTNDQGATGGGALADTDTVGLTVTAVNDGPVNTVPGAQSVDEDTALTFSPGNGNAVSIADLDASASDVRVTVDVDNGTLTLATIAGLSFTTGDGTSDPTITFAGTVAEANAALNGLQYRGTSNYNGPDLLTVTTNDQGNTGTGGALQDQDTVGITVIPVNDAPVTVNETFGGAGNLNDQAVGNTTLQVDDPSDNKSAPTNPHTEISGDILANDTDVDGPGPIIVQSAGSDAGGTNGQTADGGTVSIESDGDFVYQPPASVSCDNGTDSFNYKISDQANSGAGPIPGTAIGTVTIHLEGCVWYVHNNVAGSAGTATAPFDTLQQAETASGANHTVFVFDGDNTSNNYATGFALNPGERLIGEHEGLTVDPDQGGPMTADTLHPANPGAHPTLAATNEDVVDLDDGNEVRGFNLDPSGTGGGIAGSSGDTGGGTIDDINVVDTGTAGQQPAVELNSTTGTFNFSNLVVNNTAATSPPNTATGVRLHNTTTPANAVSAVFNPTGTISITTSGAAGLDADGVTGTPVAFGTSTFDDITVSGSTAGGVSLAQTSGTISLGDGTGTDLDITTTSGSSPALGVTDSGTVSVATAGTDNLRATGGPALDVTGTPGAILEFDDVDSTNSANDGINIDGLGNGTFSATSGDIGGYLGTGFDLNGGTGDVTYPGAFGDGNGLLALDMTGRTGGTVLLSGQFSDDNDAGGGINATGNTGATLRITGTNNVIDAGSSTAINVANTTIGTGGLNFRSVSANGAPNGIVLNTTGSTAGLTITGTATTDGSGGTIQNITNRGASFISGVQPSLSNMTFTNAGTTNGADPTDSTTQCGDFPTGDNAGCNAAVHLHTVTGATLTNVDISGGAQVGVNGRDVTNLVVSNSTVQNVGDQIREQGFKLFNLFGTSSITNSTISGNEDAQIRLVNTSGTLTSLTLSGNTIANSAPPNGNHGLVSSMQGTAVAKLVLQNNQFSNLFSNCIQADSASSGLVQQIATGNTFTGCGASGITMAQQGGGILRFNIANHGTAANPTFLGGTASAAINLNQAGGGSDDGTLEGAVTNNHIGNASSPTSATAGGDGIRILSISHGTSKFLIQNNVIQGVGTNGISAQMSEDANAAHNMSLTMLNNSATVTNSPNGFDGIRVVAGAQTNDAGTMCAEINGNTGSSVPGTDFIVRPRFNTVFQLRGYTGGGTDGTAVQNFLDGPQNNTAPHNTWNVTPANAGVFTNTPGPGNQCSQPVVPAP